ncbi:MAG TPA: hypothetical protein VFW12_09595 [Candidatus Limnocylindria bacterium]|nr:hypothetical protein [Candidatus Limnocylindria bacterium]
MLECPDAALRRLAPDSVQLQVIVGSLLGDARISGRVGHRRMEIAHQRHAYARWKYERLGSFAAGWPVRLADLTQFVTIVHPVFDDLALLDRSGLLALTGPLGLAVWLTDLGRMELRLDSFLPAQQLVLYAA